MAEVTPTRINSRAILSKLTFREECRFPLSRLQPQRRKTYLLINQAANRALGAGNYQIGTKNDYVWVRRISRTKDLQVEGLIC